MAISRASILVPAALFALILTPAIHAATASIVPYANRGTVDSDGDGVPDLTDNAPGAFEPFQFDTDADGIGDIIDPTPTSSHPNLGDPGLGMIDPAPISAGSHLVISYAMINYTPPGAWGHIDLDFGGDGTLDATYFGPLTTSFDAIDLDIAPSLFISPLWDLNTPGVYTLHAKAFAPGGSSDNDTILDHITVSPEPTSLAFLSLATLPLFRRRKK